MKGPETYGDGGICGNLTAGGGAVCWLGRLRYNNWLQRFPNHGNCGESFLECEVTVATLATTFATFTLVGIFYGATCAIHIDVHELHEMDWSRWAGHDNVAGFSALPHLWHNATSAVHRYFADNLGGVHASPNAQMLKGESYASYCSLFLLNPIFLFPSLDRSLQKFESV